MLQFDRPFTFLLHVSGFLRALLMSEHHLYGLLSSFSLTLIWPFFSLYSLNASTRSLKLIGFWHGLRAFVSLLQSNPMASNAAIPSVVNLILHVPFRAPLTCLHHVYRLLSSFSPTLRCPFFSLYAFRFLTRSMKLTLRFLFSLFLLTILNVRIRIRQTCWEI